MFTQSNQLSINEQINFTFSDSPSKNSKISLKGKKTILNSQNKTETNENYSDEEISFDENKNSKLKYKSNNKNNNINKDEFEKEILNLKNKINELEKENITLNDNLLNKESLEKEINDFKFENKYYKEQCEDLNNQVKKLIEIKSNKIIEKKDEESLLNSEEDKNNIEMLNLEILRLKKKINENEENNVLLNSQIQKDKNENNKINEINQKLNEEKNNINKEKENLILEIEKLKNEIEDKNKCIESLNKNNEEWEDEYYKGIKKLSNIQSENEKKIENLKKIVLTKYKLIISLTDQIREYEVKCTDILNGLSEEEKDKQIELLINEVNAKRKKIFDILTFNGLIDNFEEFEKVVNQIISQFNNKNSKENVESSLKKLDFLINSYKENERKSDIEILNKLI